MMGTSLREKILAGVRGLWLSLRSFLNWGLDFLLPEYAYYGLKATERSVGHCEERARSLFEELGRRKGEESLGDKKLRRRRLLSNLREISRELDGTEATTPTDQGAQEEAIAQLAKCHLETRGGRRNRCVRIRINW